MNKKQTMTIHDPFGKSDIEIEFTLCDPGGHGVAGIKDNHFVLTDYPISREVWDELHKGGMV